MKRRLDGKIGLITGGSKGIGAGVAKALALEGARVIVNYRSGREDAERIASEIKTAGGDAFAIQADVTKREDVTSLFQRATEVRQQWTSSHRFSLMSWVRVESESFARR